MSVIDFPAPNDERHLEGIARCLGCGAEWDHSSRQGVFKGFECPSCGLRKGTYVGVVEPLAGDYVLTCGCGCDCFTLSMNSAMCVNCGSRIRTKVYLDG